MATTIVGMGACSSGPQIFPVDDDSSGQGEIRENIDSVTANGAHADGIKGSGVVVAVIDTGVDSDHPDLIDALTVSGWNVSDGSSNSDDQQGHGTQVASVIAARENGTGVVGIAPESSIMAIRASSSGGRFPASYLVSALNYATRRRAPIINMSLAGSNPPGTTFYNALSESVDTGALIVVAAGNGAQLNPEYPAAYANSFSGTGQLIAVGAVDKDNQIASFSSRAGDLMDYYLVAPGTSIAVSTVGGETGRANGTSFSAPQVAGAAALLKQQSPHLNGRQIADLLLQTATDLGERGVDRIYGRGLLNVEKALRPYGQTIVATSPDPSNGPSSFPVDDTNVYFDPAVLAAISQSNALEQGLIVDSFGRGFQADLSPLLGTGDQEPSSVEAWLTRPFSWYEDRSVAQGQRAVSFAAGGGHFQLGLRQAPSTGEDEIFATARVGSDERQLMLEVGEGVTRRIGIDGLLSELKAETEGQAAGWTDITPLAPLETTHLGLIEGSAGVVARADISPAFAISAGAMTNASAAFSVFESLEGSAGSADLTGDVDEQAFFAELKGQLTPAFSVSFGAQHLSQRNKLLGSHATGALALSSEFDTQALQAALAWRPTSALSTYATLSVGTTGSAQMNNSLVRETSRLVTSGFEAGIQYRPTGVSALGKWLTASGGDSAMTFAVAQPLRIERGSMALRTPTSINDKGEVGFAENKVNLAPSGRQIDLQARYDLSWGARSRLKSGLGKLGTKTSLGFVTGVSLEPNHDARADPDFYAGVKVRRNF